MADRPMRAALLQVGYADGLPGSHSNRGEVLVGGLAGPDRWAGEHGPVRRRCQST